MLPSFVAKTETCWTLFGLGKTWGKAPSEIIGVDDEYIAYCLDQAVAYFGGHVENELDEVEGKTAAEIKMKRQAIIQRYIYPERGTPKGQFADPAVLFS